LVCAQTAELLVCRTGEQTTGWWTVAGVCVKREGRTREIIEQISAGGPLVRDADAYRLWCDDL
jgi:hypothetical protein